MLHAKEIAFGDDPQQVQDSRLIVSLDEEISMLDALAFGTLSSIAGAVVLLLVQHGYRIAVESRAPFTGTWEDELTDPTTGLVKKDVLRIRQKGDNVKGTISRVLPHSQSHRRWRFVGKIVGHTFFAIYWPPDRSVCSYGCWCLHQVDDFTFKGFYQRLDGGTGATIESYPASIKRSRR